MKKHVSIGQIGGFLLLLAAAGAVWFGLHPYYHFVAMGLAALGLLALLWRRGTFAVVLLSLLGCGAFLFTFKAAGYHYAALFPFAVAFLMLVFRFGAKRLKRAVGILAGLVLAAVLIPEAPILKTALTSQKSDAPYVIVLGAAVYGETPSISLQHRADRAVRHLKANPAAVAVLSGGQGEGEDISEAECMGRYLKRKGIGDDRILLEDRSTSTWENLTFSKAAIEASGGSAKQVAIVSSPYHLYRAKTMAASLGMEADGLAGSNGYAVYMAGMYLREAAAVWKLWILGI